MKNISIRPYETGDVPAVFEAARESIADVYPWLPWCHPDYKLEDSENWIAAQLDNWQNKTEFEFAIFAGNGTYLGGCGLNQVDNDKKVANLGYWIRSSAMGQGIAVKAVKLLAEWGFKNTDLTRFEIKCAIGNVRSQRVAEKSGAVREGIRKDFLEFHGKKHDTVIFSLEKEI